MTDEEGARLNAYSAWLREREQDRFMQNVEIERARRFWHGDESYRISTYIIEEQT